MYRRFLIAECGNRGRGMVPHWVAENEMEAWIMKWISVYGIALAGVLTGGGYANPIPWPPPASMPLEDMTVDITETTSTLHAVFSGEFTFDYIPEDVGSMMFPVPPTAASLGVWQAGATKPWDWCDTETYSTVLPELPTIPMIEWQGPFPTTGTVFRVDYEHDLIERPDEEFIFFYAMGTGKYFPTYEKTTTAYYDFMLPAGWVVNGLWLDTDPHSYTTSDGHVYIEVQEDFGPITRDLILSLKRLARVRDWPTYH